MIVKPLVSAIFTISVIGTSLPAFARPLTPAEKRYYPYTAKLPACGDTAVLGRITSRFGQKERYYWDPALEVQTYDRVAEYAFRSNGADYIPRRYCTARAILNNGKTSAVTYTIGEDLGMIGFGYVVDYCLAAYDRSWSYGYQCDALRPIGGERVGRINQVSGPAEPRGGKVKVTDPAPPAPEIDQKL